MKNNQDNVGALNIEGNFQASAEGKVTISPGTVIIREKTHCPNVVIEKGEVIITLGPEASFTMFDNGKIYRNNTDFDQTLTFQDGNLIEILGESNPYA